MMVTVSSKIGRGPYDVSVTTGLVAVFLERKNIFASAPRNGSGALSSSVGAATTMLEKESKRRPRSETWTRMVKIDVVNTGVVVWCRLSDEYARRSEEFCVL
jgi:hypothetical protein